MTAATAPILRKFYKELYATHASSTDLQKIYTEICAPGKEIWSITTLRSHEAQNHLPMEPHSMNENGKRVSGSPDMENSVKRSRATQPENYNNAEYVHALERRVALLEQVCAGLKQV